MKLTKKQECETEMQNNIINGECQEDSTVKKKN